MSNLSLGRSISLLYRYGQIYITKELEPYDIGPGQFMFLMALYHHDGLTQENLATCLNIDKGTTARAIAKLEANGYVVRESCEQDLRVNRVFLTQRAREFEPVISSILKRWTDILSSNMDSEEINQTLNLLDKMAQNAFEYIKAIK